MSAVEKKSGKRQSKMQKGFSVYSNTSSITVNDSTSDDPSSNSTSSSVYDKIYYLVGKCASTNLGQYTIEKVDGLLSVVEKTAKWSVPNNLESSKNDTENVNDSKSQNLERPCGWLPFLTLIVALRCARIGLSMGSLMIGNEPVTPESMVYFLQTRRRKLRTIKCQGLKTLRLRQIAVEENAKRTGIIEKLSSILNLVICRPGKSTNCNSIKLNTQTTSLLSTASSLLSTATGEIAKIEERVKMFNENNKNVLNPNKQIQPAQKRPLEEDEDSASDCNSDDELHCTQLLDKYGNKGSDLDDSDYVPETKELNNESDSSSTDDDDDDLDEEISENEIENNKIISAILLKEKLLNTKNHKDDTLDSILSGNNSTIKENGQSSLASGSGNIEDKCCKLSENGNSDSNQVEQEYTSSLSADLSPKSIAINPVRLSPKIAQNGSSGDDEIYENFYDPVDVYDYDVQKGLRIRCRDLSRLSGGEECFFSPIGSPVINDESVNNNYQQLQLPTVVIESATSSSSVENNIPNERTINENLVGDNQIPSINSNNSIKSNMNNLKTQIHKNPQRQQTKKGHYNNYKNNKGRKVH